MRSNRRMAATCVYAVVVTTALTLAGSGAASFKTAGYTIWRIGGDGSVCSTAPTCGDGGPATDAQLNIPRGVALDAAGNVIVADNSDNEVRLISRDGTIIRIAGTGSPCAAPPACGDNGPATSAQLKGPTGVAVDGAGNIYVADANSNEIRRIATDGTISRFAGTGSGCAAPPACGDGGPATSAQLKIPLNVGTDEAGNVFIADFGSNEVRKVAPDGTITRFAGDGTSCGAPPSCGDGGAATSAKLTGPTDVAADALGVLIADSNAHEIRRVGPGGVISRAAGTGASCGAPPSCGDGGPATSALLNAPNGVEPGTGGAFFIADTGDNEIREVAPNGRITRIAGNATQCGAAAPACGDGGAAVNAEVTIPTSLAVTSDGDVVVDDFGDSEIRWLTGPQTGPPGSPGSNGTAGAPGPQGASGPAGSAGKLVLVAFQAKVTHGRVTVRYALTGPVTTRLLVTPAKGKAVRVASMHAHAGLNQVVWNRRLHGSRARRGRYRLTVVASQGTRKASSGLSVRLR